MWRLIPGQKLHCRGWGDESVLYNDLSGDTHLLGEAAMFVLRTLQAAPRNEATLVAALCGRWQLAPDADAARDTAELLASLCALSLIEPAPC